MMSQFSIRRILLVAFLGVALVTSVLSASLAFVKARQALESEIRRGVSVTAVSIAAQVDRLMAERTRNAVTWSRLDIMQDLQVRDVDKRLSRFLSDLRAGYGDVYRSLACLDTAREVVSSSDPSQIGKRVPPLAPVMRLAYGGASVLLERPAGPRVSTVVMEVPIPSAFGPGALGTLRLVLDWDRVSEILDRTAQQPGRLALLLDAQGRTLSASTGVPAGVGRSGLDLAAWRSDDGKASVRPGAPIVASEVIASVAGMDAPDASGLAWTALIVQPTGQAFASVRNMGLIFVLVLLAMAVLGVVLAAWISRLVARPIVALTAFVRGAGANPAAPQPRVRGSLEVTELADAFAGMLREVENSRQSLVRAARLAVMGDMASVLAHEVRTPLGIMRSSAQMLRRDGVSGEERRELVGYIESQTERLNRLVSTMLDMARPRAAVRAPVDPQEIARHAVAMLSAQAGAKDVRVSLHADARGVLVAGDEEQLTQVLLNLLTNALSVVARGGRVDVTCRRAGAMIELLVDDDGPGIAPQDRAAVFETFFSRREGGIGLGLAIVRDIVLAHGGTIDAGASSWGGASFRVRLPVDTEVAE